MLGISGNNSADGKHGGEGSALPDPLPGCPRGSGPPPRAALGTLRQQESRRAGQWTRLPAAGASHIPHGRGCWQHHPAPSLPLS